MLRFVLCCCLVPFPEPFGSRFCICTPVTVVVLSFRRGKMAHSDIVMSAETYAHRCLPVLAEFDPNTPEITNAKSAIPITRIKKMERCLIFPKTAIVAIFDSLRN